MKSALLMLAISSVGFFSTASVAAGAPTPETPTPETEVTRAVEAYDQAWNRKDAAGFERLLADDYVYFTSKGGLRSRQQWVAFLGSPKYELAAAERSEIVVHRTADAAVVSSRWKGHGSYDGKPFRDDQRCGLVLGRTPAGWKVLSEHCTQIVGN